MFQSCNQKSDIPSSRESWKQEIRDTELAFSALSEEKGVRTAFLTYAAEDAVLMRNNRLVIGKQAIQDRFDARNQEDNQATLTWSPDFVDVSEAGDLGYTYGPYLYSYVDSLGQKQESRGVFHTVWKRQHDGSWKFVWD